jgi:hypothetical protein
MTVCSGCSRIYPYLDTERCMPCTNTPRTGKPIHEWPICLECGSCFEFLAGNTCGACVKRAANPAPQTQGAPTVVIHAPVVTQPPMSQCDPPGDDVRYAMTHPVNVREHGTKGGTSTINPYLVPPTTFQLDDALLESSNDVSHLILSYSLNKAVFSIAPCSEGFPCDAQFQNRIRRCNCSS